MTERVDSDFPVVAKIPAERFKVRTIQIAAKNHALLVGLASVVDLVAGAIDDRLAFGVAYLSAFVAKVEIEFSVGAEHECVNSVVMLHAANTGKQDFFFVRFESPSESIRKKTLSPAETIARSPSTQIP